MWFRIYEPPFFVCENPEFLNFNIFVNQKVEILDKRPRQSTDLEEYVFLVPKNII